jgi:AbrB family looped-hinge helix DNA binding protein
LGLVVEVFVTRLVADGRVTIPKRVRDFLNIEVGDYVRVSVTEVIKKTKRADKGKGGIKRR